MPYRICKTLEVQTGHMLSKSTGGCRAPHGHSRHIELVLETDKLDANNMVYDFTLLKKILIETLKPFDHATCMNTNDDRYQQLKELFGDSIIGFEDSDPTTEVISKCLFDKIQEHLRNPETSKTNCIPVRPEVKLKRIRVWETGTAWAEYTE